MVDDRLFESLRYEYTAGALSETEAPGDPFALFREWFADMVSRSRFEPNAMTLSTADGEGMPSSRTVLLKSVDEAGFVFFTNYRSRKGRELAANPRAALLFYWPERQRQVRVAGLVNRVPAAESDDYFRSRPLESRLGAWASDQSDPIPGRHTLTERLEHFRREFADGDVPRPGWWGGYRLAPVEMEFWQGRPNRLHDRLVYTRGEGGAWRRQRLAP